MSIGKNLSKNDRTFALLRERDVAARWIVSLRTLQRWRAEGAGPPFVRLGGAIRYRMTDILAFEERMQRGGGGTP